MLLDLFREPRSRFVRHHLACIAMGRNPKAVGVSRFSTGSFYVLIMLTAVLLVVGCWPGENIQHDRVRLFDIGQGRNEQLSLVETVTTTGYGSTEECSKSPELTTISGDRCSPYNRKYSEIV